MGLVHLVSSKDLSRVNPPLLVFYSKQDQVVDARKIERTFEQFGTRQKVLYEVTWDDDPSHHVLAGDILSPSTTDSLAREIVRFIEPLVPSEP